MGSRKLLNTSSSPPIAYKRYSNNCEEQKPLQKQEQNSCSQHQQYTAKNSQSNNINTTCLLIKHNTNTMFTKLRNYFTQLRTTSTSSSRASASAISASQKYPSRQQRKRHHHQHYRHEKLTECNSIPIVQSASNMLNIVSIVVTLVFLASFNGAASSPIFVDNPSLAQFQSGRNIRHLPCIVRKSGRSGVCMFAIDCIKQNGTHLGTCIDRFYFGSCCDIKEKELTEIADNSIDQNTISHHFTSESSTVPTSALFKITTESPMHHAHGNTSITHSSGSSTSNSSPISSSSPSSSSSTATQPDVTHMLNGVTQAIVFTTLNDNARPTTLVTNLNTGKPFKSTTTTKPSQQTTHKQSHFVIRTTAKPTKYTTGSKPLHNTTIKKKPTSSTATKKPTTSTTTTTTTKRPSLTTTEPTQQRDELPADATTQPTKLFTYQIVDTTAYTPTEVPNMFDFVTTERVQHKTTKVPQKPSSSIRTTTTPKTTTTKYKETTTSTTETVTTYKTTQFRPKPQTTRKPTTTKKPTSVKRTTVQPTRKPITTTSSAATTTNSTDVQVQANSTTEMQSFSTSSTIPSATKIENKTTFAPRPRPKPTASIVKVSKPATTTTRTTTTSTTTASPLTTSEAEKAVSTTTTTSSTAKPPIQTTQFTTTAPTKTTTATSPKTTATTTHKVTHKPILTSTTHKPGLVTWTNIDGEPMDPNQPIISDWVPVTSIAPLNTHNKVEDLSSQNVTFEEMDVSVSSSVSAMVNNTTVIISPPQKPILMPKPSTTTTTTSPTTSKADTTTTLKPIASSSEATTEQVESNTLSDSSSQFITEGFTPSTTTSPTGFSTEEITTEYLNLNSTTTNPPITGLEGVDYRQVCGRRMFPEPRVVGGSNAAFARWPWQISLRQWRTSTYLHKCGAALLNENWAITAAHCVDNVPPSDLLLRLGEYDLAEEEEPYGYQERRVQIVASHPQFDPRTFEYDLALLRFYEPVVFQPNIIPVCVPESDEDFIGQTAFVTGWGRLYEDGPLPSVLQEVAVPVINNTICESMYRAAGYIEHIPHIFICAGWKKGGYDSCEGDSGGPMVLQREADKRFQLGGVISWGIGCAEANQPGVYTRISEFRDWINQILQF